MSSTQFNTGRREEINYEQSKKDFLKLAEQKLRSHRKYALVYQLHTKKRIEQIIAQKLAHPSVHAKYEVIMRDGINILVMKRNTDSYIQVLSWEEMFDIFMPLHVRCGHREKEMLKKEILIHCRNHNIEYKFPKTCINFIRHVCTLCVQNNGRFSLLKVLMTGIVHVIAMAQTRLNERFRYMLIYADKETHYVILRPLTEKNSLEISAELFKIFTQLGPPMRLLIHGYNSTLTEKIGNTLNEICPKFRIETEHQPTRYELPTVVTDRIQNWMNKSKSLVWELGCLVVQAEMNKDPLMRPSRVRYDPCCTPHSLYFHTHTPHSPTDHNHVTNQAPDQSDIQIINLIESDEDMSDNDSTDSDMSL